MIVDRAGNGTRVLIVQDLVAIFFAPSIGSNGPVAVPRTHKALPGVGVLGIAMPAATVPFTKRSAVLLAGLAVALQTKLLLEWSGGLRWTGMALRS